MISYALITNGYYNPFLNIPLPDHMKYPISQNCAEGLDLDYSALMLGEQFIIDETVYDEILASRKEYFAPMKRTFRELKASGLLVCRNYEVLFKNHRDKIINMTNMLLENPKRWLELEQNQWDSLQGELLEFQTKYGSSDMKMVNTGNIGIESWLAYSDQFHNTQLREDLYALFGRKKDINDFNIEDVRGVLRFIVAQIVMSDLVSSSLKMPVLDWDDSKNMYEQLYSIKWEDCDKDLALKKEASKLFNVIIPDLKPNNINAVIKFICDDKSVVTLRETLMQLITNGESVSQEWMTQYINQIMSADLAVQKRSSIFQFFGTLAGIIPGLSWAQTVAVAGASTVGGNVLFQKPPEYDWYYALQKIVKR